MVVTCLPSAALTGITQERTAAPSRCTVQAPHCAIPQPYLVPVRPTCSRITHSRGVLGLTLTSRGLPLIVKRAIAFPPPSPVPGTIGDHSPQGKRFPVPSPARPSLGTSSRTASSSAVHRLLQKRPSPRQRRRQRLSPRRLAGRRGTAHAVTIPLLRGRHAKSMLDAWRAGTRTECAGPNRSPWCARPAPCRRSEERR